jgi:hypothetical protein
MLLACNMSRQAGLAVELVNLAVSGEARGHLYEAPGGDELTELFASRLLSAAELRAVPDAGRRLGRLAAAFRPVFTAPDIATAAGVLNGLLQVYRAQPYLVEDVGQPFHLHFHGNAATAVESLGGEFATALALAVDTYGELRFGTCAAAQCDRAYVDLTKNGSRRYCSDACSSRAKTAAYRSRQSKAQ